MNEKHISNRPKSKPEIVLSEFLSHLKEGDPSDACAALGQVEHAIDRLTAERDALKAAIALLVQDCNELNCALTTEHTEEATRKLVSDCHDARAALALCERGEK